MRSAVNVVGLPQARVPDNRHVIGVANSIGSNIRQGMERRKEESNKERAAAIARELVSGGVGEGLPQAIRPQLDPQTELQVQQANLVEQKKVQQAQEQGEKARRALVQRSNMQSMLNDPATKASLIELQSLDPQMARTVFTMLASADEQERLQVAQEAKRANDIYQNAAYFAQQDLAGGKGGQLDAFLVDAIRQEHARGGDVSRLMEMHRAGTDERIGLIQRNLALSGTVLKMPEVERITALEQAKLDDADADRALKRERLELDKRAQSFSESQAKKKADQPTKSEVKAEEQAEANKKAFEVYQVAMGNLERSLSGINTGPISGRLFSGKASHQIAAGARAQMAPVLKSLFRQSGEGTFSDGDRQALLDMLPKTTDSEEAVQMKVKFINQQVMTKLGVTGATSFGAVGGSLPQGITEADIQHTMQKHGVSREEVLQRLGGQ